MSTTLADVIVCSFYTDDDYYREWARKLEENLDELGVPHVLREVRKQPGQDWADICRKKVAFLDEVCREYPDKRVYWTDVDCQLLDFPEYLHTFTADIIGFQHGFAAPMQIGYGARTRFWAPSFLGINTTAAARTFVADAARLERESPLKATDDYFFEESWRANASVLNFQIIPAGAVLGRGDERVPAFFKFGSSGNVPDFVKKVVQHTAPDSDRPGRAGDSSARLRPPLRLKDRAFAAMKRGESLVARLDPDFAGRLKEWAKQQPLVERVRPTTPPGGASAGRVKLLARAIAAGQQGRTAELAEIADRLAESGAVTRKESDNLQAAAAFAEYAGGEEPAPPPIPLVWWPRPFPGNFGDWLSPLVVSQTSGRGVRFVPANGVARRPHLVAVGSVARFINDKSIVAGTGASAESATMHPSARYRSLRGPLTAAVLRDLGGPSVDSFGDPAVLLRRILPVEGSTTNGRLLLVRHFTHRQLPVTLPEEMDETSVFAGARTDIVDFVTRLAAYDGVVTSAMHVAITCHSYGIPVALIGFKGFEDSVSGSGMKYRDYSLGAGLDDVWEPEYVHMNLTKESWRTRLGLARISDDKLDEVSAAIRGAIEDLDSAGL